MISPYENSRIQYDFCTFPAPGGGLAILINENATPRELCTTLGVGESFYHGYFYC